MFQFYAQVVQFHKGSTVYTSHNMKWINRNEIVNKIGYDLQVER